MVVNLAVFIVPLLYARDLLCFEEMRKTDYQSSFIQISAPNFDQFMFYLLQTASRQTHANVHFNGHHEVPTRVTRHHRANGLSGENREFGDSHEM